MKIKLSKNWRYGGQVNMAGTELEYNKRRNYFLFKR